MHAIYLTKTLCCTSSPPTDCISTFYCLFIFIFMHAVLLVGDQPHDGPVFRKHFWSDQDPEDCEDLKKKVLEHTNTHAGVVLIIENSSRLPQLCWIFLYCSRYLFTINTQYLILTIWLRFKALIDQVFCRVYVIYMPVELNNSICSYYTAFLNPLEETWGCFFIKVSLQLKSNVVSLCLSPWCWNNSVKFSSCSDTYFRYLW